jgi:hypothetical protein
MKHILFLMLLLDADYEFNIKPLLENQREINIQH